MRALGEAIERTASSRISFDAECRALSLPEGEVFDVLSYRPPSLPMFSISNKGIPDYLPFSPERAYRWRRGERADGSCVWVPIELVYYPVTRADVVDAMCGNSNSNGVAAAASMSVAKSSAFFELIERDAYGRAWISGEAPYRLSEWPEQLLHIVDVIREAGLVVELCAFQTHAPTAAVAIRGESEPALAFGMATRDNWDEAIEKALQEALSHRVAFNKATLEPHESLRDRLVSRKRAP